MYFLYPIGLFAFAALIVPLVIHLWQVKHGKTLKIGSISLLGASAKASSKSFKINEVLLFVLRCLLLILIALLIAQPYLDREPKRKAASGWIVVHQAKLGSLLKTHGKKVDSLTALGYTLHDLRIGFPLLSLQDTLKPTTDTIQDVSQGSLLKALNRLIPVDYPVYLYADRRLNQFGETLPMVDYQLNWLPVADTDTLSRWTTTLHGKKYHAISTPSATRYQAQSSEEQPILRVNIYEDANGSDRKYVMAALEAIASYSDSRLVINSSNEKADVGFWLSAQPVSVSFKDAIKQGGHLLQYEKGRVNSTISTLSVLGSAQMPVYRRINTETTGRQIWKDGFGQPILTEESLRDLSVFHFYSRFNPKWTELVWSENFVTALMPIVLGSDRYFGFEDHPADQRVLSDVENIDRQTTVAKRLEQPTKNKSFPIELWVAAFLILVIERILFFKQQSHAKN